MVHDGWRQKVEDDLQNRKRNEIEVLKSWSMVGEDAVDEGGKEKSYGVVNKVVGQPNEDQPQCDSFVFFIEELFNRNLLNIFLEVVRLDLLFYVFQWKDLFSIELANLVDNFMNLNGLSPNPEVVDGLPTHKTLQNKCQ